MNKRQKIRPSVRFSILERDGFQCYYCGRKPPDVKLHLDHRTPIARGGTNDPDNLVTSCDTCNGGKSDRSIDVQNARRGCLVGQWFIKVKDGYKVHWVGQVVDDLGPDGILVDLVDGVMAVGCGILMLSGDQQIIPRVDALQMTFYRSKQNAASALGGLLALMEADWRKRP